jgi:malate dehydrogenase (oxaloacetate-decarboxylating)
MDEWELFPRVAVAVATAAQEQGVARRQLGAEELHRHAEGMIRRARDMVRDHMERGFIAPREGGERA